MKLLKTALITATAAAALSGAAMAQVGPTPSASADANATVVAPIAITKASDLDFGQVTEGNVVLAPNGTRSGDGIFPGSASTGTAAKFNVSGEGNAAYFVTLPNSANLTGPGPDLIAALFTATSNNGPINAGVANLASGSDVLNVGASLTIPSGQAAGAYSGTFNVSVQYQ